MSSPPDPGRLRPLLVRPRGLRTARVAFRLLQRATAPVRRGYYVSGSRRDAIERLPPSLRTLIGLDDPSAIGSRRVEIGGGPHAQRGYLHIDIDPSAHHLEWVAPALLC